MQNNQLFDTSGFTQKTSPKYALALVNITGLGVKTFSYLIPDEMKDKIQIGQAILVPFGRQGLINAFCVGFSDYLPEDIKAKSVSKILDEEGSEVNITSDKFVELFDTHGLSGIIL